MSTGLWRSLAAVFGCIMSVGTWAARVQVLPQIDLPHHYYYREMYLPQLTSGPSSVAWSPDSSELVYSMAGVLWRQKLGEKAAYQLTGPADAAGTAAKVAYDYQPDWSPDGRSIIFSRYDGAAVELWRLDVASGSVSALTQGGAVNVEPRFSPDGKRLVFVSTRFNGRFHVFVADLDGATLRNVSRVTGENRSTLPRYYYSAFDTEINPTWAHDGREIVYVSNRGHLYGTGGIWRVALGGSEPHEIHYEETNWRARPEISPDGSRLVYSSYLGRQWHNLWLMPSGGGDAFPLTYGDWDQTNARWAPDGRRIAYISNQAGSTQIALVTIPGGEVERLPTAERHHRQPMTRLHLQVRDAAGNAASARIGVTDASGRFYAPADSWVHGDDAFDRAHRAMEAHYYHLTGDADVDVPVGSVAVEVMQGFERRFERRMVQTVAGAPTQLAINIDEGQWQVPDRDRWISADVHVHMNYGGTYRNTPAHLAAQARAEHLNIVNSLIVNKEQRFPDIAYSGGQLDAASSPDTLIVHGQEYHSSYWGHVGLLDIHGGLVLPGYVGYPNTAAASLYPMNADVADIAHARGALLGYVHVIDEEPHPFDATIRQTSELPADVALGKVDYMEIVGFADHRFTAAVWYRLLNLGFRIPAAGGTDAMANYASLRGPVGMNRMFARVPRKEALTPETFLAALKSGRTFATNGPLLGLHIADASIGDELRFEKPQKSLPFTASLQSLVPVDHLDLVCNGQVMRRLIKSRPLAQGEFHGHIPVVASGWCVLRASTDGDAYPVLDNYAYATTSPIYIQLEGVPPRSPQDARYFAAWIDRVADATAAYPDWNSATERQTVLERLTQAKATFTALE